jgi:hypothetical protein
MQPPAESKNSLVFMKSCQAPNLSYLAEEHGKLGSTVEF